MAEASPVSRYRWHHQRQSQRGHIWPDLRGFEKSIKRKQRYLFGRHMLPNHMRCSSSCQSIVKRRRSKHELMPCQYQQWSNKGFDTSETRIKTRSNRGFGRSEAEVILQLQSHQELIRAINHARSITLLPLILTIVHTNKLVNFENAASVNCPF